MKFAIDKKVTLLEWGIILVLCLVFALYFISFQTKVLNLELDERASVLLNNLALNMEYPILVRDREAIERLTKGVMAQKDIIFCRVEDKAGTTLFREGSKTGDSRVFSFPVVTKKVLEAEEALILNTTEGKKEEIGKIYLAASLSGLKQKISDMKKVIITLAIGAIVLASLGTYVLLKKIIGEPVLSLVKATDRIAAGDLRYKVPSTSEDEFGLLADSFNKMTSSLLEAQEDLVRKEKLATLGKLSGSVGHELRNPLGVISNAIYFLKTVIPDADETVREYLNIIKNEVDNSQRIITDLLDFARTKTPQARMISINEMVSQSLGKCTIPEGITVGIDIPETLPMITVDPLQMGQVFQNLITNAVQAMPNGGTLRVSARLISEFGMNQFRNADYGLRNDEQLDSGVSPKSEIANPQSAIEISVTDTGEGISPENMEKLFQPLFTTKAKGIGLGLTVVKNLTEANGGRIKVESEIGKGTTFTVTLKR